MVPLCGSSHHFTDFFDIRLLKTLIQSLKKKERKKTNRMMAVWDRDTASVPPTHAVFGHSITCSAEGSNLSPFPAAMTVAEVQRGSLRTMPRESSFVCLFELCDDSDPQKPGDVWASHQHLTNISPTAPAAVSPRVHFIARPPLSVLYFVTTIPPEVSLDVKATTEISGSTLKTQCCCTEMVEPVFALAGRQIAHHFALLYPRRIKKYF